MTNQLPDIQSGVDKRGIGLDQVGVSDLRYPIIVLDKTNGVQHTVARLSMSVSLPHNYKGTHMSRFIEVLNQHRNEFTVRTLPAILNEMKFRLKAESARIEMSFPYFIEKKAPVTEHKAMMDYQCFFLGESSTEFDDFVLGVDVPVASLCPCSKEISDYGAHNQRGVVSVRVRMTKKDGFNSFIWVEELIEIAESSASSPLYSLLKRPDERFVTMQAYDRPAFVEDITREVAVRLKNDQRIDWFEVRVTNFESIHNHNAFASTQWKRENHLVKN
ncbi:GTP cyclohydrolase FolE2 [Spirosoma spitsbergense]|uniref:GTP cyclohydrolase FolE2 n=1 Tax=Spirosoma spitsbergense TaxID=431554 RepID=UPI0003829676|nr:GTP cyclohydrolase FolE2 [Spirosoma spitsbergense]